MVIYTVRMEPTGTTFKVAEGERILDAALRQGVPIRYGCRHGNCSSCKYLLIDGEADLGRVSPYSLSEREREEGWALLCCASPLEDLEIQNDDKPDPRLQPVLAPVEGQAVVATSAPAGRDLWRLTLLLDDPVRFYAGQYVELEVPGRAGVWRSYSVASPPGRASTLDFVIKRIPGGRFSDSLDGLNPGDPLKFRGPYGTNYLRDGDAPVLLAATGSGIAPVLSILEHAADTADERSFTVFYGAKTRVDLVAADQLADLADRLQLTVFSTLSGATADCHWTGPTGRVTSVLQREVADASPYDAYLCGNPAMCDSVALLLEAKGIQEGHIFFDRFYPADEGLD